MKKIEAFFATQYPCPDCGQINTMRGNLEHINEGYSGYCRKCKKLWRFKEAVNATSIKIEGSTGIDRFLKALRLFNSFAIDFDCDNCGETNTILPISITTSHEPVPEVQSPPKEFKQNHPSKEEAEAHLDSHFGGYNKIVSFCTYENGEDRPTRGKCQFCKEEYELVYPLLEQLKPQ